MSAERPPTNGPRTLVRSLRVLNALVQAAEPATATELAERLCINRTSVSRMLSALQAVGFVRKPDYHHFSPDYGLFLLAGRSLHHFPLVRVGEDVVRTMGKLVEAYFLTVCTIWRNANVVLLRKQPRAEPDLMPCARTPLHLSVAGLRLLLEMPQAEAIACLEASRAEMGWRRPTDVVPATASQLLAKAASCLEQGVLTLTDWAGIGDVKSAAVIHHGPRPAAALALAAERTSFDAEEVASLLALGAGQIEAGLPR